MHRRGQLNHFAALLGAEKHRGSLVFGVLSSDERTCLLDRSLGSSHDGTDDLEE